jgi:adenosylcobyric acid synthase
MAARALMLQGTGSEVGKSLIVAALGRAYTRRGLRVRPFKSQNMSNNAAVTQDGGEIGRAQALQALACGVEPTVHMNPVLLKPQSEVGAQVVLQGRVHTTASAREYQALKPKLLPHVLDSFERISADADLVLVEGAGSPAEVNLRAGDIANMGFARAAQVPVVLVGDVDRGGVIASLIGTQAVMDAQDRALVRGFLINKFRGDPTLFEDGMAAIVRHTGWPSFGLYPYHPAARRLPAEDAFAMPVGMASGGRIVVAVPWLPHVANFDDLDPLEAEPSVEVRIVPRGRPFPGDATLVLLPGSKSTIAGLAAFRADAWDQDLAAHLRRGGFVLGLCGGYQMLGRTIADPHGIEGPAGEVAGLGFLNVDTVLAPEKTVRRVTGVGIEDDVPFDGYEIHLGVTRGPDQERPVLRFDDGRLDGAMSANGRIRGVYVHGLFAQDRQRASWLRWLGGKGSEVGYRAQIDAALDELAEAAERHLDLDLLLEAAAR